MFSSLIPIFLAPLALAIPLSPDTVQSQSRAPTAAISQFTYSGSGCTRGFKSVTVSTNGWANQAYTFTDFGTSSIQNCELHFQGSGLSSGYQVSVAELDVYGKTTGAVDAMTYFWQVYWSDDASNTLTLTGTVNDPSTSTVIKAKAAEPLWSECIGADGNPGILNVNFMVVVAGDGMFVVNKEVLKYQYRKCQ